MSVDHLPARTAEANGSPNGTATRTAIVLNADDIHRDWREPAATVVGGTLAISAAGALYLTTFNLHPHLAYALAGSAVASAVALIVLLTLIAREGRRWVYATDADTL